VNRLQLRGATWVNNRAGTCVLGPLLGALGSVRVLFGAICSMDVYLRLDEGKCTVTVFVMPLTTMVYGVVRVRGK
jgi:hypothetical protein